MNSMIDISTIDPQQTLALLLQDQGALVGTMIFPPDGTSDKSVGGYRILHPRKTPSVKDGNLRFFTLDVGIGVYEVLVPLDLVSGQFTLCDLEEPVVESPSDELWRSLGPSRTWPLSVWRDLLDETTSTIKRCGLKFRPVVDLPVMHSFPHPVSFPRFSPFTPREAFVVYYDQEMLSRRLVHADDAAVLLDTMTASAVVKLADAGAVEFGRPITVEGAIGFFSPAQEVTWKGHTAELVAISSQPFSPGNLGADWILGCIRNECFPFFRESVERLSSRYYIWGEWRDSGAPFITEYGERDKVLVIGGAIWLPESQRTIRRPSAARGLSYEIPSVRAGRCNSSCPVNYQSVKSLADIARGQAPDQSEIKLVFDDCDGLVYVDGNPIGVPPEGRELLKILWRSLAQTHCPVKTRSLAAAIPSLEKQIGHLKKELNPAIAHLLRYDLNHQGWTFSSVVGIPRVFMSYCRENIECVKRLRDELVSSGLDVWWDQMITPGSDWEVAIDMAISGADFVVLCLSGELTARYESGVFPEVAKAIAHLQRHRPGSVYLEPVMLSACEIPALKIDATRTLRSLECVRLFPESTWRSGVERLVSAIIKEAVFKSKSLRDTK
jgi:hypothetical protein